MILVVSEAKIELSTKLRLSLVLVAGFNNLSQLPHLATDDEEVSFWGHKTFCAKSCCGVGPIVLIPLPLAEVWSPQWGGHLESFQWHRIYTLPAVVWLLG